jgi:hypothetical protein
MIWYHGTLERVMAYRWCIDQCNRSRVAGWIDNDGPVDAIEIVVNEREVARLAPTDYRKDLEEAGIGDGRRSFSFPLSQYLVESENEVLVRKGEMLLHAARVRSAQADYASAKAARARARVVAGSERSPAPERGGPLLTGEVNQIVRRVSDKNTCDFYHVVDLPEGTTTDGFWDLREKADEYLGDIELSGKRVIEIGPASGFLSFHMERQGARVAAIEPPIELLWDLVPQANINLSEVRHSFGTHLARVRNSFWYLHTYYGSNVECYEIEAYHIPPQPVQLDIGVRLMHLLPVKSTWGRHGRA